MHGRNAVVTSPGSSFLPGWPYFQSVPLPPTWSLLTIEMIFLDGLYSQYVFQYSGPLVFAWISCIGLVGGRVLLLDYNRYALSSLESVDWTRSWLGAGRLQLATLAGWRRLTCEKSKSALSNKGRQQYGCLTSFFGGLLLKNKQTKCVLYPGSSMKVFRTFEWHDDSILYTKTSFTKLLHVQLFF